MPRRPRMPVAQDMRQSFEVTAGWGIIAPRYAEEASYNIPIPMPAESPVEDSLMTTKTPFKIVITSMLDGHIKFQLHSSPRGQSEYTTSNRFNIRSSAMPELSLYTTSGGILYSMGHSPDMDTQILRVVLAKLDGLQFAMCEWTLRYSNQEYYEQVMICPCCHKQKYHKVYNTADLLPSIQVCANSSACELYLTTPEEYEVSYIELKDNATETSVYIKNSSGLIILWGEYIYTLPPSKLIELCCDRCGQKQGIITSIKDLCVGNTTWISSCKSCEDSFICCSICESMIPRAMAISQKSGGLCCPCHLTKTICDGCLTNESICFQSRVIIDSDYHRQRTWVMLCDDCTNLPQNDLFDPELRYDYKDTNLKGIHSWKGKGIEVPLSVIPSHTKGILSSNSRIPFLGMEIEQVHGTNSAVALRSNKADWVPNLNRVIRIINDAFKSVFNIPISFCKHDGSIPRGTEIVTNPLSLEAWKQVYKSGILAKVLSFSDIPNTDKDTIGGHIHLSRAACTKGQIYRMTTFIHENIDFISQFCGRAINNNSRWCSTKLAHTPLNMVRVGSYTSPNRYTALNLTEHTLEHRYFATPTEPIHVMQNVEFVHAMWCASKETSYLKDVESFFNFVRSNHKEYPVLEGWVKEKSKSFKKNNIYVISNASVQVSNIHGSDGDEDFEDDDDDEGGPYCDSCGTEYEVRWCRDTEEYFCTSCGAYTCSICNSYAISDAYSINNVPCCNICYNNTPTMDCPQCGRHTYSECCGDVVIDCNGTTQEWCECCLDNEASYCGDCDIFRISGEGLHCECVAAEEEEEEEV